MPTDKGADELRYIPDAEDPDLATWQGDNGDKSRGFAKHPPKPGLPTDADDAGRDQTGDDMATDEFGRKIVMKDR
jgi:hypothetical protein